MTDSSASPVHPHVEACLRDVRSGAMNRREFLARASALGATAATAYGLLGETPATAQPVNIRQGGTLRIQHEVNELVDPRSYAWSQSANFARGWLEYLVQYDRHGLFEGRLLQRWFVNEDATEYVLVVRPNVTWNNGDPFTAIDVARNIELWCDRRFVGNSMAGRMSTLIDPDTNLLKTGAIQLLDSKHVRLKLPKPDITIIPSMADYPAAIVHGSYSVSTMLSNPVGTGPYLPESFVPGEKAVLVRNRQHKWWGKGAYLDRIEFIDLGTDPRNTVAAAHADQIDMTYDMAGDYITEFDQIDGWRKSVATTAATLVIRPNQDYEVDGVRPYADVRVRKALALAVDNGICLELGYEDRGKVAENHHVCPIHPEYARLEPLHFDPVAAKALMVEAGFGSFEHELVSVDDEWIRNTTDAVHAQLLDAGIKVKRTIVPVTSYRDHWAEYGFSSTEWNMRPLGVQVLALAYRSGETWNETRFSNREFDALLDQAMAIENPSKRREVMAQIEQIMRDEAVIIQPYWRSLFRHAKSNLANAEMHPTFEIHVHKIGYVET